MEIIHIKVEKKGRGGKTVTLLTGFTRDQASLDQFAERIKKACGTGGTVRSSSIEIQGDLRSRIKVLLQDSGFQVKG